MKQYLSKSVKETKKIASEIAKQKSSGVIALVGDLGAGKTAFVQGFAEELDLKEKIISPTFVLIRQHKIPQTQKMLYHLDLYRLKDEEDFHTLGLKDILNDENNLVLIEWAEKVKALLPKDTTWVLLEYIDKNQREITVT